MYFWRYSKLLFLNELNFSILHVIINEIQNNSKSYLDRESKLFSFKLGNLDHLGDLEHIIADAVENNVVRKRNLCNTGIR